MILEWFDPRKFSIRIWSEGNTFRFEAAWPLCFPFLVSMAAGGLLVWWLT